MRRALVLTNETSRHPFRASLPPHILNTRSAEPARTRRMLRVSAQDVKDFLLAYCACFIATTAFLI